MVRKYFPIIFFITFSSCGSLTPLLFGPAGKDAAVAVEEEIDALESKDPADKKAHELEPPSPKGEGFLLHRPSAG